MGHRLSILLDPDQNGFHAHKGHSGIELQLVSHFGVDVKDGSNIDNDRLCCVLFYGCLINSFRCVAMSWQIEVRLRLIRFSHDHQQRGIIQRVPQKREVRRSKRRSSSCGIEEVEVVCKGAKGLNPCPQGNLLPFEPVWVAVAVDSFMVVAHQRNQSAQRLDRLDDR